MATTDITLEAHRPLASFAWDLRQRYSLNRGVNKQEFMSWYDLGEIELSTVYENIFVATRNNQLPLQNKQKMMLFLNSC